MIMCRNKRMVIIGIFMMAVVLPCLGQMGCSWSPEEKAAALTGGIVGTTILGARSPSHEIEQIYYFGVFDPQEQVPPTVYRVRVHGQASFISFMRFGSGWVPAQLIDSLGTGIEFQKEGGGLSITKAGDDVLSSLQTGRRLVQFGPEGFRESPKNHRLVIVMGSSPEKFFAAIDQSLGVVSEVIEEQRNSRLSFLLFEALSEVKSERERLYDLEKDIEADLPKRKVVGL